MRSRSNKNHPAQGRLFVFEGPDGVGKTTLATGFAEALRDRVGRVELLSFPGKEPGSLGRHVYELHHDRTRFGVLSIVPASLQLLHVAAHIDAVETTILPLIRDGVWVVLDRYWWSVWVYGSVDGAGQETLRHMIDLEQACWGTLVPNAVFLVQRPVPFDSEGSAERWQRLKSAYAELARAEAAKYHVIEITAVGDPADIVRKAIKEVFPRRPVPSRRRGRESESASTRHLEQLGLPLGGHRTATKNAKSRRSTADNWRPAEPTKVFDTFWRFAAERQAIFFRRFRRTPPPWTNDPILTRHKFTNPYRASDRVSQFLIGQVIYAADQSPNEVLFRTLLFKLFNRIETWHTLERALGRIRWAEYSFRRYDDVLCHCLANGERIYSAAYIMPPAERGVRQRKHQTHLRLIERMMADDLPLRLRQTRSMREAFELLRSYPMIGNFLAYQYVTDINYSTMVDFSEMEFAVPGPGALGGIQKCFLSLGGLTEADLIRLVAERQEEEFRKRGLTFQSLWGRPLQLIDCQNLFCEVDKYARIYHPEVAGRTGRERIKQLFRPTPEPIRYWFPPKWGINDRIRTDELE